MNDNVSSIYLAKNHVRIVIDIGACEVLIDNIRRHLSGASKGGAYGEPRFPAHHSDLSSIEYE
jgi:hypothetical protein